METFRALRVYELPDGTFEQRIEERSLADLPAHEVVVQVLFSSLNYKDALSAEGNRGVTRQYPHTPGIDAVGVVVQSADSRFVTGDQVIVTSYDLGMNTDGGLSQYISVPANWVLKLPMGLSPLEAMIYGTAGLTAAMCLDRLISYGLSPEQGEVIVTGASGGVGSMAVALLANLGYQVVAVSGKPEAYDYLKLLGASRIIDRSEAVEESDRPLLKAQYAGAVDTVGGNILATILRSLKPNAAAAICGLVNSPNLRTTVFPFILRGNAMFGIDSAEAPMAWRVDLWHKLAHEWKLPNLSTIGNVVKLDDVPTYLQAIREGRQIGRVVVELS